MNKPKTSLLSISMVYFVKQNALLINDSNACIGKKQERQNLIYNILSSVTSRLLSHTDVVSCSPERISLSDDSKEVVINIAD